MPRNQVLDRILAAFIRNKAEYFVRQGETNKPGEENSPDQGKMKSTYRPIAKH